MSELYNGVRVWNANVYKTLQPLSPDYCFLPTTIIWNLKRIMCYTERFKFQLNRTFGRSPRLETIQVRMGLKEVLRIGDIVFRPVNLFLIAYLTSSKSQNERYTILFQYYMIRIQQYITILTSIKLHFSSVRLFRIKKQYTYAINNRRILTT